MSSVMNTVAEVAISAVSKMKEGAHNIMGGPAAALSPKAESQEDVATGVTTKYGFCGLGKDDMLTSVVQKMSSGDKNILLKLFLPNDPHHHSTTSLGGPSLQFADTFENLFRESEVIFLATSGDALEEYAKSGLLRSAVSADGSTKAVVVFGEIENSVMTTIAAELAAFKHIDLLKVMPLSKVDFAKVGSSSSDKTEKSNANFKQTFCACGSEQVIGKIGDFLNAMGGRPMYVGTNFADAAKLPELYAAYESIVAAALFEVSWEFKQLDVDLRHFFRQLTVQRMSSVNSAVELADAFVNSDSDKIKILQKSLDARLAVARQTLTLKSRAQPVNLHSSQSNGSMSATNEDKRSTQSTSREIVENGIADAKPEEHGVKQESTPKPKAQQHQQQSSANSTANSTRSSSRTRRTGAAVVNDAARVHIMGAEDEDDDEDAGDAEVPSLAAGSSEQQQPNGNTKDQKRGPGRPKKDASESQTSTRSSTRTRTSTVDSGSKQQNGAEQRRPVGRPPRGAASNAADSQQSENMATRKAAKGGLSDVAVDPSSTKVKEPSPNTAAAAAEQNERGAQQNEQQQPTATTTGGETSDRKFFKSTGGPAASSNVSTPGKIASAFGKLNELKQDAGTTPSAAAAKKAESASHAPLSQPSNAVDIADLPDLDTTTATTSARASPTKSDASGKPGRKVSAASAAAEKKKSAQIAQSAKRIKSKQAATTGADDDAGNSESKSPAQGTKRGADADETDDTAGSSKTQTKKQAKGGKTSPTAAAKKKGASSPTSKKRPAADDEGEDEAESDSDADESSEGAESEEPRFTLDDAKRETDRGAGWKELPEIMTPTNIKYVRNDIVWSKITGYPWWPAQVVGLYQVMGKQSPTYEVRVTWLGDNNWSDLKIDQIAPYTEESKGKHNAGKKKDKSYQLACMAADLLKANAGMSVVDATEKAKVQYSTRSPQKGGKAAAAPAAAAGNAAATSATKKNAGRKKHKTDADEADAAVVAAPTRARESLRRGAKDKPAAASAATDNVADKKQPNAAADAEKNALPDNKATTAESVDSAAKQTPAEPEATGSTSKTQPQAEQDNKSNDDSKTKSNAEQNKTSSDSAVPASDDGEEGTSALEIDEGS